MLEECSAKVQLLDNVHLLLCGDYYARTSNIPNEVYGYFQSLDVHSPNDTDLSDDDEDTANGKICLICVLYLSSGVFF